MNIDYWCAALLYCYGCAYIGHAVNMMERR